MNGMAHQSSFSVATSCGHSSVAHTAAESQKFKSQLPLAAMIQWIPEEFHSKTKKPGVLGCRWMKSKEIYSKLRYDTHLHRENLKFAFYFIFFTDGCCDPFTVLQSCSCPKETTQLNIGLWCIVQSCMGMSRHEETIQHCRLFRSSGILSLLCYLWGTSRSF